MAETPIEIMKAAHDAEFALWNLAAAITAGSPGRYRIFRDDDLLCECMERFDAEREMERLRSNASIRAALRALAEMESELVIEEGADVIAEGLALSAKDRPFITGTTKSAWKAMCLAAAAEGEKS